MCYFKWKYLVAMVTMATNKMKTMAKFALIKGVPICLYEYDKHSRMDSVHLTEIFEHQAYAISTKISACSALMTRVFKQDQL